MNEVAICVLSFKRPDYLKRCCEFLVENRILDGVDFWLIQDGAVDERTGRRYAGDDVIEASVGAFGASNLPSKTAHLQQYNVGPAMQICWAFGNLFYAGYGFVVVMPDDTIVNKNYVKTVLTIYRQFKDHPAAGILRTCPLEHPGRDGHIQTEAEARDVEDMVDFIDGEYSTDMGLWHRTWRVISPTMGAYEEGLKKAGFRDLMASKWDGNRPELQWIVKHMESEFGSMHEDVVPVIAAGKSGLKTLRTLAPRSIHVGPEASLDRFPEFYYRLGYDRYSLYDVGDVDRYFFPSERAVSVGASHEIRIVYPGPDHAPFSIRGEPSRKVYWRVRAGEPFDVIPDDIPNFERLGFVRAW